MNAVAKKITRAPAVLAVRRAWQRLFGWRWFQGDYATWAEARAAAPGYDDAAVLERVREAGRAVKEGRAAWDRDGATFTEPAVHAPLLAVLRQVAAENNGRLDVVDFGGGLGGTWRQHRAALSDVAVRWCIVEQPHFVAAGVAEFTGDGLTFASTLAEASARIAPTVILFSSVLQYLERPKDVLAEAVRLPVKHIVIDRLPLWSGGRDWLTVQRTPPALGGGGYPAWVFDRKSVLAPLQGDFALAGEWPGFDSVDSRMIYHGLHFTRKETA